MGTYRHHHVYSDDIGTVFIYFRKTSSLEESRIYFSKMCIRDRYTTAAWQSYLMWD